MAKKQVSSTSIEAWRSLDPTQIAEIYRGILYALGIMGNATFEEIAAHMKVDKSRVWKRMSELERMKLVYRPGFKKPLKSGRLGYEWALTNTITTEVGLKELKSSSTVQDHSRKIQDISKQAEKYKPQTLF